MNLAFLLFSYKYSKGDLVRLNTRKQPKALNPPPLLKGKRLRENIKKCWLNCV